MGGREQARLARLAAYNMEGEEPREEDEEGYNYSFKSSDLEEQQQDAMDEEEEEEEEEEVPPPLPHITVGEQNDIAWATKNQAYWFENIDTINYTIARIPPIQCRVLADKLKAVPFAEYNNWTVVGHPFKTLITALQVRARLLGPQQGRNIRKIATMRVRTIRHLGEMIEDLQEIHGDLEIIAAPRLAEPRIRQEIEEPMRVDGTHAMFDIVHESNDHTERDRKYGINSIPYGVSGRVYNRNVHDNKQHKFDDTS